MEPLIVAVSVPFSVTVPVTGPEFGFDTVATTPELLVTVP